MSTQCYAMVRGSTIRVTGLDNRGKVADPAQFAVSKTVAKVQVNEVAEAPRGEILESPEQKYRLRFHKPAQTIRHTVDIDFLRVDPGVLSLVAGVRLVYRGAAGFGMVPFGEASFGNHGDTVVGFDSGTRLPAVGFGLEVWSKLDPVARRGGSAVLGFDEVPFDTTGFEEGSGVGSCAAARWGYTVFPYLRGGRLSGFQFTSDGLVSFNLIGAQTRRGSRWGVGPYDLEGPFRRLVTKVSGNTSYRQTIIESAPPSQTDGIQTAALDVLDNGTASNPMPDPTAPLVVDGGGASTEAWIIDGGRA